METCGLKQADMAQLLDVNLDRVKSLTAGRVKKLAPEEMEALVTKLRISPDWIVSGGQGEMFMPQLEHARWLAAHATQKAQRAEIWRVQERALAWPEPGPPRNRAEAELLAHWRACTKRDRETISDLAARLAPPTA